MKTYFTLFFALIFSALAHQSLQAAVAINSAPNAYDALAEDVSMELADFKTLRGEKLRLKERIAYRIVQKKINKSENKTSRGGNTLGLLALIFGILGLLLFWLPVVGFLGFLLGVAAFILGILGIKRDANPGMAIAGLVLGSVMLVILLLAVVIIGAFLI